eukprot:Lithocolla_globosa_v1_NODE_835_length_3208_cov_450.815097.p2 type:complete len:206 gc:universal NODE_835_length_3208_cov_450.815097:417-1034(+)
MYVDAYPLFKWSRICNMQTSVQLRILGGQGVMDIFCAGRYFGDDDLSNFDLIKHISDQFQQLELEVPDGPITVIRLLLSDGKTRRMFSGKPTACSDYGVPEGPIHRLQYTMLHLQAEVCSTAKRTNKTAAQYQAWLKGRTDNVENKRQNFGDGSLVNHEGVNMEDMVLNSFNTQLRIMAYLAFRRGYLEKFVKALQNAKLPDIWG